MDPHSSSSNDEVPTNQQTEAATKSTYRQKKRQKLLSLRRVRGRSANASQVSKEPPSSDEVPSSSTYYEETPRPISEVLEQQPCCSRDVDRSNSETFMYDPDTIVCVSNNHSSSEDLNRIHTSDKCGTEVHRLEPQGGFNCEDVGGPPEDSDPHDNGGDDNEDSNNDDDNSDDNESNNCSSEDLNRIHTSDKCGTEVHRLEPQGGFNWEDVGGPPEDSDPHDNGGDDNEDSNNDDDNSDDNESNNCSSEDFNSVHSNDNCGTEVHRLEPQGLLNCNNVGGPPGDSDPEDNGDDDNEDSNNEDDNSDENDGNNYWQGVHNENPQEAGNNAVANNDDVNSDASEPSDDGDESEDPSDPDSDDNEGERNLSFNPVRLNAFCRLFSNHSVKEVLAVVLALFDRHSWTYEALLGCLQMLNTLLGCNYFPRSKKPLWKSLNRKSLGIKKQAYCPRCRRTLGRYKDLGDRVQCVCRPNFVYKKKEVPYFMQLDLKSQLTQFLARPDAAELLFSKGNRVKHNEDALEDIYDGSEYKRLEAGDNPILGENDFSYTFNSDGFLPAKSSAVQVHPIYVRLNELPMNVRQKHLFLAGVWIDKGDPEMFLYLQQCLVCQGNRLAREGVTWNATGKGVITSKFIATCCTVDAKARCVMMNMMVPTAFFGCTFCPIRGVQANGVHFPIEENMPLPRTHREIVTLMEAAHNDPRGEHQGVRGRSALKNLLHFDLGKGMSTDDLHPLFEGVVLFHMDLLLTEAGEPYYIGAPQTIALINARLLSIKPPTLISRTPRGIDTRAKWRGHEWRNWILYFIHPCLTALLPARYMRHIQKLSRAIFIVSRDSITEAELQEAERLFIEYVTDFQNFFGVARMRYNIHVLLHVVRAVRCWGPAFVHSTFNFESWNMKLKKHVKSMKDPILQIVNRHLITSFISSVPHDEVNFSPDIQQEVSSILMHTDLKTAVKVGDVYLLGQGYARYVSIAERLALENVGIVDIQGFTIYQRALFGRLEIRSTEYRRSGKNSNSHIFTWDGQFFKVLSVAKVTHNNVPIVVLFVHKVEVDGHVNIVSHIAKVALAQQHQDIRVCLFEEVRGFALHIECAGLSLIVPMANSSEID